MSPRRQIDPRLERLAALTWVEFEHFAVDVLRRFYRQHGFDLVSTRLVADGGRDGDASLMLGPETPEPLSVLIRLWVEVKKRRATVALKDVGGHVLLAFLASVTKLVIVTNVDFAPQVTSALTEWASRTNFQLALVDGSQLVEYAEQVGLWPPGSDNEPMSIQLGEPSPGLMELSWTLGREPGRVGCASGASTIRVAHGEPVFLNANLHVKNLHAPTSLRLVWDRFPRSAHPSVLATPATVVQGDRVSFAAPIWPAAGSVVSASEFIPRLEAPNDESNISVRLSTEDVQCETTQSVLGEVLPASRDAMLEHFDARLRRWVSEGGTACILMLASAGSGKSHLLRLMRRQWLLSKCRELNLDGGLYRTDSDLFRRVAETLLPGRTLFGGAADESIVAELLRGEGFPSDLATLVSSWILSGSSGHSDGPSETMLGRALGRLIAAAAKARPLVVALDDLHKVSPSGVRALTEAIVEVQRMRDPMVFFLVATRGESEHADASGRMLWTQALDDLVAGAGPERIAIPSLSPGEATELLRSVVPDLNDSTCADVLRVVGRTPFALRETLAFLRDTEAIRWNEPISRYLPASLPKIQALKELESLRSITHARLQAARDRIPPGACDFLDAGACLGSVFRSTDALTAVEADTVSAIEGAVRDLERMEVLRPSTLGSTWVAFDHDLIRREVLSSTGFLRRRRLAGVLLDECGPHLTSKTQALLAYQASRPDECAKAAAIEAASARQDRRFADEAESLMLALAVVDPPLATSLGGDNPAAVLDDALEVVLPSQERHGDLDRRRALEILQQLAQACTHLGSGSGEIVERSATEIRMLSEYLGDPVATARSATLLGQVFFERDRVRESVEQHREADLALRDLRGVKVARERARNLVRLAIGERELGQLDRSRQHLEEAMRLSADDADLRVQAITNIGATYFHIDWTTTHARWTEALALAHAEHLVDREIHLMLDLNRLDVCNGRKQEAWDRIGRVEALLEGNRLEFPRLRYLTQRAVLLTLDGALAQAHVALRDAEDYALRHRAVRRLWKIRANLATVLEVMGSVTDAYVADTLALNDIVHLMTRETLERATPQRAVLPIANVLLRSGHRLYTGLIAEMPPELSSRAKPIADAVVREMIDPVPFSLAKHLHVLDGMPRFLLP